MFNYGELEIFNISPAITSENFDRLQLNFANSLLQPLQQTVAVQKYHLINTSYEDLIDEFCDREHIDFNYQCYSQCTHRSKKFKKGYLISQYVDIDISNTLIYVIKEIVRFANFQTPYIICDRLKVKKYHDHFQALEICNNEYNTPITYYSGH